MQATEQRLSDSRTNAHVLTFLVKKPGEMRGKEQLIVVPRRRDLVADLSSALLFSLGFIVFGFIVTQSDFSSGVLLTCKMRPVCSEACQEEVLFALIQL